MGGHCLGSSGLTMSGLGVFVVGTSHAVASAEARERLHLESAEVLEALTPVLLRSDLLTEALPLVTCGRLELYGVSNRPARAAQTLTRLVAQRTGFDRTDLAENTFELQGKEAVQHLLRVSAGLDSVVHGEAQILGQVRSAAHDPKSSLAKGTVLHRLFELALLTGKRVRSETRIGHGAASLAGASLKLVYSEVPDLDRASVLIVGAGDTGSLVARLLAKRGVGRIVMANRTLETAHTVAASLGATAVPLSELAAEIAKADLVVGAAGDSHHLITPESVLSSRENKPLWFIDLAHPRNVHPDVTKLLGVRVFDLDAVASQVESAKAARLAQTPKAEEIVLEGVSHFEEWFRSRDSVEVLTALRSHVLKLANDEAERLTRGRSDNEKEEILLIARALARTLLHHPTVALRSADLSTDAGQKILRSAHSCQLLELAYDEAERLTHGRSEGERKDVRLIAGALARTLLRQPEMVLPAENRPTDSGQELLHSTSSDLRATTSRLSGD